MNTEESPEADKAVNEEGPDAVLWRRETAEELQRRLNMRSKYEPHQGMRERARRLKQ